MSRKSRRPRPPRRARTRLRTLRSRARRQSRPRRLRANEVILTPADAPAYPRRTRGGRGQQNHRGLEIVAFDGAGFGTRHAGTVDRLGEPAEKTPAERALVAGLRFEPRALAFALRT